LLIEQQTFSATPQIASRAVAELGMYSPTLKDKLIIQPGAPTALAPAASSEADITANDSDVMQEVASTDLSPAAPPRATSINTNAAEAGR
jgi:cell division protein FtsL